jgi:hypothetical protein
MNYYLPASLALDLGTELEPRRAVGAEVQAEANGRMHHLSDLAGKRYDSFSMQS